MAVGQVVDADTWLTHGLLFDRGAQRARSRLWMSPLQSSEFVLPACLDSIAGRSDGQVHSAYISDHGNRPGDRQPPRSGAHEQPR